MVWIWWFYHLHRKSDSSFGFGGFADSVKREGEEGWVREKREREWRRRGREKRAWWENKEREWGRKGLGERKKRESRKWRRLERERERERLREWEREREITDKIGLHYLRQCHWYALCSCCNAVVHSNIFPGSSRAFVRPQEGALWGFGFAL